MICMVFGLFITTNTVRADDVNTDVYHAGDVAAIQKIIQSSPALTEKYNDAMDNPGAWEEIVAWTENTDGEEKRVRGLNLSEYGTDISGELDVSALTALDSIDCSYTGITALNVTKNTKLAALVCSNTGITALDVASNTALETLECSYTGITALDVAKNTALVTLDCSNTGINTLDVTNNTELLTLNCAITGITTLDVTNNAALKYLYCFNTGITALDISNLTPQEVLFGSSVFHTFTD